MEEVAEAEVIFGSRFPQDLEYTQICININRIRLAMNEGRKVILLNLETLYESLYELLNQSYEVIARKRFVEIGLGTQRYKTAVHNDFRLIVVAEYDEVRRTFPVALVNRLEKHAYFIQTDMAQAQKDMANKLKDWATCATNPSALQQNRMPGFGTTPCRFAEEDVFVGYSSEAVYSLISSRFDMVQRDLTDQEDLQWLKEQLIHTCVPEGVLRMADSELGSRRKAEAEWAAQLYFDQPLHNSLKDMLPAWLPFPASDSPMMQITSYQSQILADTDKHSLQAGAAAEGVESLVIWQLRQFNTEAAFEGALREVFERDEEKQLLLIQCLAAQQHPKLIDACRYKLEEMRKRYPGARVHVGLILMLHRLPFHLPERVKRWLEAGRDPVLQLTSHRNLTDGDADKSALIQAAGLVDKDSLHLVLESNNRQVQLNEKLEKAKLRAKDKELGLQLIVIQFHHFEERKPTKTASDVRGSLMKELEEAGESGKRVKVVLVTTLPRTGSFPGRGWKSWHLDNLSPEPGDLPNIGRLATQSLTQLLAAKSGNTFDARSFVKMCVAEAASRIQDEPAPKASRCTLFINLLDENGGFCDEVIRRLAGLVAEKEEELGPEKMKHWVQLEAKNIRSVVDSRTFSKALRRRLETVVAPLLAGLLCFLDSYSNLAVLAEKAVWRDLWLELLKSDAIVASLRLHSGLFQKQGEHSGMKTEFVVLGNGRVKANFPFSWLLSERLEALIVAEETRLTVANEMVSDEELLVTVAESLKRVPWGETVLVATQDNGLIRTVIKDYITDLAHLRIRLPESVGYQMLLERVGSQAMEWRQSRGEPNSLLASQLAFQRLQPELTRYQRLAHGFPDIAGNVEPSAKAIDLVLAEAILHFLARHFATTKQLKDDVEPYLQTVIPFEAITEGWKGEYDKWNTRFRHAVAHGIKEIILEYEDKKPELRLTWTALEVARLFISHVSHLSYHFTANSIYRVYHMPFNVDNLEFHVIAKDKLDVKCYDSLATYGSDEEENNQNTIDANLDVGFGSIFSVKAKMTYSQSDTFQKVFNGMKGTNHILFSVKMETEVAQFVLRKDDLLLDAFLEQEINHLPDHNDSKAYQKFLDHFGPFYVHGGTLGGRYEHMYVMDMATMNKTNQDSDTAKNCLSGSVSASLGIPMFSASGGVSGSHCTDKNNKKTQAETITQSAKHEVVNMDGGTTRGAGVLIGVSDNVYSQAGTKFTDWMKGVRENPILLSRIQRPICHLFQYVQTRDKIRKTTNKDSLKKKQLNCYKALNLEDYGQELATNPPYLMYKNIKLTDRILKSKAGRLFYMSVTGPTTESTEERPYFVQNDDGTSEGSYTFIVKF